MTDDFRILGRIMVIEDERLVRSAVTRLLQREGHTVFQAATAEDALRKLPSVQPDVIVADIKLGSGMSGVEFLRLVGATDLDLPVILWTGDIHNPAVLDGFRLGALDVVKKDGTFDRLMGAVKRGLRIRALTRTVDKEGARAELQQSFMQALSDAWMVAQPIVDPRGRGLVGWELLLRTSSTVFANTGELIQASRKLKAVQVLAHRVRTLVAEIIETHPENKDQLFVNVDPSCLDETDLYSEKSQLAAHARRITLEITESAPIEDVPDLRGRLSSLRRLGYQIAIDDFGAGFASLGLLVRVQPDILKIDMSLIRNIHEDETLKHVVKSTVELAHQLGIAVIAEGIEKREERGVLESLLVDGLQGYGVAYPALPFNSVLLPWP